MTDDIDKFDFGPVTFMEALYLYRSSFLVGGWADVNIQEEIDCITRAIDKLLNLELFDNKECDEAVEFNDFQRAAIGALAASAGDYQPLPNWTYERLGETLSLGTEEQFKILMGAREGRSVWRLHRRNVKFKKVGPILHDEAIEYRKLLEKLGVIEEPPEPEFHVVLKLQPSGNSTKARR
jgi:hypothetical protein